jgi:hypothetical protein
VRQAKLARSNGCKSVRVRPSEPPGNECCGRRGDAGSEAYTVIAWGVGLSHEMTTLWRPRPSCEPIYRAAAVFRASTFVTIRTPALAAPWRTIKYWTTSNPTYAAATHLSDIAISAHGPNTIRKKQLSAV